MDLCSLVYMELQANQSYIMRCCLKKNQNNKNTTPYNHHHNQNNKTTHTHISNNNNNWMLGSACKLICVQHLPFRAWLTSLSMMLSAFNFHLFSFKLHNFIFLFRQIMLCVPHFNIHPFVDDCFCFFAILNRTVINVGVRVSSW